MVRDELGDRRRPGQCGTCGSAEERDREHPADQPPFASRTPDLSLEDRCGRGLAVVRSRVVGVGRPGTRRIDRLGRRLREELPCPSCKVWVDERELRGYGLVSRWAVAARRFVTRVRLEPRTESPRVGVGFAAEDAILVGFVGGRLQASSRCAGRRKLTQKYASARKADGRQRRDQRPSRLNTWSYTSR